MTYSLIKHDNQKAHREDALCGHVERLDDWVVRPASRVYDFFSDPEEDTIKGLKRREQSAKQVANSLTSTGSGAQIIYKSSAASILTPLVRGALDRFFASPVGKKLQLTGKVQKVEISGISTYPEADARIVVTQWVRLPAQLALAYWDELSDAFEQWVQGLTQEEREAVLDLVTLDVQWETGATSI